MRCAARWWGFFRRRVVRRLRRRRTTRASRPAANIAQDRGSGTAAAKVSPVRRKLRSQLFPAPLHSR